MPSPGAASTTRRTAFAPARWPATRGSPRAFAQRPLPSMIMATCIPAGATILKVLCITKSTGEKKGRGPSAVADGLDDDLHVVQVAPQRAPPLVGQPELGAGDAALERLGALHVAGLLELAGVHAQVAVGERQHVLQLVQGERLVHRQRAHDRQ